MANKPVARQSRREFVRNACLCTSPVTGLSSLTGSGQATQGERTDRIDGDVDRVRWSFPVEQSLEDSSPTVVDGTVYVGSRSQRLSAIDAESGEERWHRQFENELEIRSSPVVLDGRVYVMTAFGGLYALDASNGDTIWSERVESFWDPAVTQESVFVGEDSGVRAFDAATGALRWERDPGNSVSTSPVVLDDAVLVGGRRLSALDPETGAIHWSTVTERLGFETPTVSEGTVYVPELTGAAGTDGGQIVALDGGTGDRQWAVEIDEQLRPGLTVTGQTLLVSGRNLYAIDLVSEQRKWQLDAIGSGRTVSMVADGVAFVAGNDGAVRAITARGVGVDPHERERWRVDLGVQSSASPTVADGTVYATDRSTVYAVEADITGSGECSRAQTAAFGHHGGWDGAPTLSLGIPESGETVTADDSQETGQRGENESDADESGAGFGVIGAVGAAGGAAYGLSRFRD